MEVADWCIMLMKYYRKKKSLVYLALCYAVFLSYHFVGENIDQEQNSDQHNSCQSAGLSQMDAVVFDSVQETKFSRNFMNDEGVSGDCFLNLGDVALLDNYQKSLQLVPVVDRTSSNAKKAVKTLSIAGKSANFIEGKIENNFYSSACKVGVPSDVIRRFCNIFSSRVNFKSSLKNGDSFWIAYDPANNNILYARIKNKKHVFVAYAYDVNGKVEYLMGNGEPVAAKGSDFFRLPIPGARISSPYGRRKHPVFGVIKNHTGVDFAAGYGTPVRSASSGYVSEVGFDYGYGRYIIVNHSGGYRTRYAHLSKSHVKKGQKVGTGSVIGLVGSSGISTGPHLHFELVKNGVRMNPLTRVKVVATPKLCGTKLSKFIAFKNSVDKSISSIISSNEI